MPTPAPVPQLNSYWQGVQKEGGQFADPSATGKTTQQGIQDMAAQFGVDPSAIQTMSNGRLFLPWQQAQKYAMAQSAQTPTSASGNTGSPAPTPTQTTSTPSTTPAWTAQKDPNLGVDIPPTQINGYWTGVENAGHTSRELLPGENANSVQASEAAKYGLDPSQVQVVNSGGHTYFQIPWNLAQNHALAASSGLSDQQLSQMQQAYSQAQQQFQQQQQFTNLMNMMGINPSQMQQQAQSQYNTQSQQIQDIINQDRQQQQSQDSLLQNQLNDSVNSLNNTTFQDWLKAREGIAQRGLANSGLLNDAMVRTQLGAQDKMQGLYNTFLDNLTKGDAQFQNDIMKQQQALENLSPDAIYQKMFQDAVGAGSKLLPFQTLTADQQASLSGQLPNGQLTLQAQQDQMNNAKTVANETGVFTNPFTGQSGETLQALKDAFDEQIAQGNLTGIYNGSPTEKALEAEGLTVGIDPKTGKIGVVPTETATNNNANLQFKYDQLSLTKWFDQQKVADMQANTNIAQGKLDLARQDATQKNFIAQEGINDTRISTMLKGYTSQMSSDISGMDSILKANGGSMPDKSKNPQAYADYQKLYNDYIKANSGFNDSFTTYTQNMGK